MDTRYRKTVIVGNWKMNMLPSEVRPYAGRLRSLAPANRACDIVLCVPHVLIPAAVAAFRDSRSRVFIGAQNLNEHPSGAYTGEVSGAMLSKLGCRYVVVGHSERREYHNESDELVNAKAKKVIENGMTPIICCGEALEVRKAGKHVEHTVGQIKADLDGIFAEQVAKLVIAYEPIWAIGTGETATADDAQEVCQAIREAVKELYDAPTAEAVRIQYGGSVKPANVAEIMAKPDVDGALVGGASLKAGDFSKIVTFYEA